PFRRNVAPAAALARVGTRGHRRHFFLSARHRDNRLELRHGVLFVRTAAVRPGRYNPRPAETLLALLPALSGVGTQAGRVTPIAPPARPGVTPDCKTNILQ